VAIQAEISFVVLYKNQPSLGDVDLELRSQGFVPHCFARDSEGWHFTERTVDIQMIGDVSDHLLIDPLQFG
jgi:hypothetical protein